MLTQPDEAIMLKKHIQLNVDITPVFETVQTAIEHEHERHLDNGELIVPGYTLSATSVACAVCERLLRDLNNKKVPAEQLRRCAEQFDAENYSRGVHFYLHDETAQTIMNIVTRIMGVAPDLQSIIYFRGDFNSKSIVSIAVYYAHEIIIS